MKHRHIKTYISVLSAVFMLTAMSANVFAYATNSEINTYEQTQNEIDAIFTELNELALPTYQVVGSTNTYDIDDLSEKQNRQAELDQQLESLGVHKIDPTDSEDIAQLEMVMQHTLDTEMAKTSRATLRIVTPPNITTLANSFTCYQSTGVRVINGTSYDYSYVRIVDNKGSGRLTQVVSNSRLLGNSSTILSSLLQYNFSFGVGQLIGALPGGWVLNWGLGNVFTAVPEFNNPGQTTVTGKTGSTGIYTMNITSVTEMTYFFAQKYGDWVLFGSRASNVSYARADAFTANIGGKAVATSQMYSGSTSTGYSWTWYYDQFVSNNANYYHPIGSFTINGQNNLITTFAPKYYNTFIGLY